jgi:hypothetical protein
VKCDTIQIKSNIEIFTISLKIRKWLTQKHFKSLKNSIKNKVIIYISY